MNDCTRFRRRWVSQKLMKDCPLAVWLLSLLLAGCAGEPGPTYFRVSIEQGGRPVPIRDHQARLDRQPFAILVHFRDPDAVLVNASFHPRSVDAAEAATPFEQIVGFRGRQISEEPFNQARVVHVSDTGFHSWYYFSEGNSKFDAVTRTAAGWTCRRTVLGCVTPDRPAPRDIRHLDRPAIYLVFVERQRDYLKLLFQ